MNETGMWIFGGKILAWERHSTPRKARHNASPTYFTEGVPIVAKAWTEYV
jgi:hypothetical protein